MNPIGFDDAGWNSDDTRDSSGANIVNDTTNDPASGASFDPSQVDAQVNWRNVIGSRGNLGGVFLDTSASSSQKSTLSKIDADSGLTDASNLIDPSFSATYRWQNNDTVAPGTSLKFGIQSTVWGTDENQSQDGFSATRSGEGVWDLILVFDPTNNNQNSTVDGAFLISEVTKDSQFFLFPQAGSSFWSDEHGTTSSTLGIGAGSKTLEEWAVLHVNGVDGPTWGEFLFGTGAVVSNLQFGMGSGNEGAATTLDWADVSFLNDGNRINFVEAARYEAGDSAYENASNWIDASGDSTPASGAQNYIIDAAGTTDLTVGASTTSRSLGILAGTTNLTLASGQTLTLSASENGTLFVETGATANISGEGTLNASVLESAGTLNVSTVTNLDGGENAHPVRDGSSASTSRYGMVVHPGGEITLVSGADVTIRQDGYNVGVRVGEDPGAGAGTLNIESGASLTIYSVNALTSKGFFHAGDWGSTGVVNQTGGTFVMTDGSFNLGNQGGTGTYNLSDGTATLAGGLHSLGRTTGTRDGGLGVINLSGGTFEVVQGIDISSDFVIGDRENSNNNGTGVVNQTGGIFRVDNSANLYLGGFGASTYNLEGGTLEIGGNSLKGNFGGATSPYDFNLQGGTIQVTGSDLNSSVNINVLDVDAGPFATTSYIDTNSMNAILSGAMTGAGVLAKIGEGILSLTGTSRTLGAVSVDEGVVNHQSGTTGLGALLVGAYSTVSSDANGIFTLTDGTVNLLANGGVVYIGSGSSGENTGTLNIHGGTLNLGIESDPSVRVDFYAGAFGSTGAATVTQTGGVVNKFSSDGVFHIGNQSSTDNVYNLEAGAINIYGPNGMVLGRSSETVAGNGTLNVSGGTLTFFNGGDLLLGGAVFDEPQTGLGTVNQTGGTVSLRDNGTLVIGQRGSGVYNLNGGVLEVGGSVTQNTPGTSEWNFGGGTLRVIEKNFSTALAPAFVPGTNSTIDTNGFNASFIQGFTGEGDLTKTGAGDLMIGGTSTLVGDLTINQGHLAIGSASAGTGVLNIESGATVTLDSQLPNTRLVVGQGGDGTLNLNGGTINLQYYTGSISSFVIGRAGGSGTVNMTDGLITVSKGTPDESGYGGIFIGSDGGATTGVFNQSGGTIQYIDTSNLHVGTFGAVSGEYNMSNDAQILIEGDGTTFYIGQGGSNGTVNMLDNSRFIMSGDTQTFWAYADSAAEFNQIGIGTEVKFFGTGDNRAFHVGMGANGIGTYNLEAGSLEFEGLTTRFGSAQDSTGILNQSGGTLVVNPGINPNPGFAIGNSGTGEYNISDGNAMFNMNLSVASGSTSTGTVNQTGGTVTISEDASLRFGSGTGTYNLDGGVLEVGGTNGMNAGSGTATVSMGGGELRVIHSRLTTHSNVGFTTQDATTSIIDVGSHGMTMNGELGGSGILLINGSGNFALSGDSSAFSGILDIQSGGFALQGAMGGNLSIGADSTLSGVGTFSSLTVAAGGSVAPGNSIGTLSGENMTWSTDDTTGGMVFELSNIDNDSDQIQLTGDFIKGAGNLFLFDFNGTGFHDGINDTIYTLVGFSSTDFAVDDFSYTNLASGLSASFELNSDSLQLVVIPELSTLSLLLLAGLTVCGTSFLRRRRKAE
ncbi:MAG: hypothetical protein JJU05_18225 [Verrucomicrobia bacterium]|nr:hypothetical protein [Verrucomicrobiota bacterium]MCH8528548.1 hypothetical protein [Kiritimatiellia bacterium]